MNDTLISSIRKLRLSGLLQSLEIRLQEAAGNNLSPAEFLELILQDELNIRNQRLMERRTRAAGFRDIRTLEDFDFSFNPTVKRKQIFDLASCRFIREQRDVLFIGPPGVGKSHLPRRWAITPSAPASPSCTAPSSMRSAICARTKRSAARIRRCANTSSRIC